MSVRETVAAVRSLAREEGIKLGMARMSDAISLALYQCRYSSAVAADRAGRPPSLHLEPAHAIAIAQNYDLRPDSFINVLARAPSSFCNQERQGVLTFPYWLRGFLYRQPRPLIDEGSKFESAEFYLSVSDSGEVKTGEWPYVRKHGCPFGTWHEGLFYLKLHYAVNGASLWELISGPGHQDLATIFTEYRASGLQGDSLNRLSAASRDAARRLQHQLLALPHDNTISIERWMSTRKLREIWPSGQSIDDALHSIRSALPFWDGKSNTRLAFRFEEVSSSRSHLLIKTILCPPQEMHRWHARYALMTGEWAVEDYAEVVCLSPGDDLAVEASMDAQIPFGVNIFLEFPNITEQQSLAASAAIRAHLQLLNIPALRLAIAVEVEEKGGQAFQPDLDLWDDLIEVGLRAALPHAHIFPAHASLYWDYTENSEVDLFDGHFPTPHPI